MAVSSAWTSGVRVRGASVSVVVSVVSTASSPSCSKSERKEWWQFGHHVVLPG